MGGSTSVVQVFEANARLTYLEEYKAQLPPAQAALLAGDIAELMSKIELHEEVKKQVEAKKAAENECAQQAARNLTNATPAPAPSPCTCAWQGTASRSARRP